MYGRADDIRLRVGGQTCQQRHESEDRRGSEMKPIDGAGCSRNSAFVNRARVPQRASGTDPDHGPAPSP